MPQGFLDHVQKGDPIRAKTINQLIDVLRGSGIPAGTPEWSEPGLNLRRRRQRRGWPWVVIRNTGDEDFEPFSIFELYQQSTSAMTDGGIEYKARLTTTDNLPNVQLYGGNEDIEIPSGCFGWAKVVTPNDPVLVRPNPSWSVSMGHQCKGDPGGTLTPWAAGNLLAITGEKGGNDDDNRVAVIDRQVTTIRGLTVADIPQFEYGYLNIGYGTEEENMLYVYSQFGDVIHDPTVPTLGATPVLAVRHGNLGNGAYLWLASVQPCPPE